MLQKEPHNTQQADVLGACAPGLAADEEQPTTGGQEATPASEEPLRTPAPTASAAMEPPASAEEPAPTEEKRAVSPQKLAANRANAAHSTGPKTPEGKEKSKLNAVKHGFTARYFPAVIQAGTAEWEELEAVRKDFLDHYQPVNPVEQLLLEKISIEYMRYRRLVEREQQFCVRHPGYFLEIVNKLARYQTAINRQLFEAIEELERMQEKRKAGEGEGKEDKKSAETSD